MLVIIEVGAEDALLWVVDGNMESNVMTVGAEDWVEKMDDAGAEELSRFARKPSAVWSCSSSCSMETPRPESQWMGPVACWCSSISSCRSSSS